MFESTAEPNYSSRPELLLGSAHVKFDVWTGPKALSVADSVEEKINHNIDIIIGNDH